MVKKHKAITEQKSIQLLLCVFLLRIQCGHDRSSLRSVKGTGFGRDHRTPSSLALSVRLSDLSLTLTYATATTICRKECSPDKPLLSQLWAKNKKPKIFPLCSILSWNFALLITEWLVQLSILSAHWVRKAWNVCTTVHVPIEMRHWRSGAGLAFLEKRLDGENSPCFIADEGNKKSALARCDDC